MKINLDDPKLTAYALNELSGPEKSEMEATVATSPEAQAYLEELREFSGLLKSEYNTEREHSGNPAYERDSILGTGRSLDTFPLAGSGCGHGDFRRDRQHVTVASGRHGGTSICRGHTSCRNHYCTGHSTTPPIDVFADATAEPEPQATQAVTKLALPTLAPASHSVVFPEVSRNRPRKRAVAAAPPVAEAKRLFLKEEASSDSASRQLKPESDNRDFNTATYDHIAENPFLPAARANPLSTFSIDVDTASYSNVRRFIDSGCAAAEGRGADRGDDQLFPL